MPDQAEQRLRSLQQEIDRCRLCEGFAAGFSKPHSMARNPASPVVAIGVAPGRHELTQAQAFTGPAGKRLWHWLGRAGIDAGQVYGTSLVKCATSVATARNLSRMWVKCGRFFLRQMEIVRPRLVVTLGREPLRLLFGDDRSLKAIVGTAFAGTSLEFELFPFFDRATVIVPLPHPSPRSRWVLENNNAQLLDRAIAVLAKEGSQV